MKGKSIFKTKMLLGAVAGLCLCSAVVLADSPVKASANGEQAATVAGFEMLLGAEVRSAEDGVGGIRFTTNVSADAYASLTAGGKTVTFYTLFARADKFDELDTIDELTVDKVTDDTYSDYVLRTKATEQPNGTDITSYKITYKTDDAENYGKTLMARGVAEVKDAEGKVSYVYATANENVRTMKQVALAEIGLAETETDAGLEKYFTAKTEKARAVVEKTPNPVAVAFTLPEMGENEKVVAAFTKGTEATEGARIAGDFTSGATLNNVADQLGELAEREYELTFYTDQNNAYTASLINATKIIKNKTDLAYFVWTTTTNVFDGYYVLGNNISDSTYSHASKYPTSAKSATGLTGTFDGQGYTIDGIKLGPGGLFGAIMGNGTVKNLAVTNVGRTGSTTATYNPVLAGRVEILDDDKESIPRLENVYVYTADKYFRGVFYRVAASRLQMENCIFEISGDSGKNKAYGSFCADLPTGMQTAAGMATRDYENVYLLSTWGATNTTTANTADAMNISGAPLLINGMYRYESASTMASGKVGELVLNEETSAYEFVASEQTHDFTAFTNSGFWKIGNDGIPVWNNLVVAAE